MRIAVLGCGKQGQRHLAALAGLPDVTHLVAADLDSARRVGAAARVGAVCAASVDAVFADRAIDAVVIATPTPDHLPLAARAIASRKHFLCEKPFGADAATARRLARDAAKAGLVGRVGYLYRFAPAIAAARAAIPDLGAIDAARFVIAAPGGQARWKHRRDGGGGAINELASHMVDLALWCFGPLGDAVIVEKARTRERRAIDGVTVGVDAEDKIVARFRNRAGVVVTVAADFAAPRFSQEIEIRGERGTIRASIEGSPDLYRLQAQSLVSAIAGSELKSAGDLADAARTSELLEIFHRAPFAMPVA